MGEVRRTFVALAPPPSWRTELARSVAAAYDGEDGVRVVASTNIHLTLAFLGDIESGVAIRLADELRSAIFGCAAPLLALEEPPRVTRIGRGSALVLGVVETSGTTDRLANLHGRLIDRLREIDLAPTDAGRPLRPHLTVARLKSSRDRSDRTRELRLDELENWNASRVDVVFSELTPEGARYSSGGEVVLGG